MPNPPDGGGVIIIHGKRLNGTVQSDQSVTVAQAQSAITVLRTAPNNAGATAVADALQAAVDFDGG
jgi:hypothetical protein